MGRCSHWKRQRDRESMLELYSILAFYSGSSKLEGSSAGSSPHHFLRATLRGQFSLSICERMSGTVARFTTCKVIACLSTGGQGVKPLAQCWPAGSPCASGSLWESLYSPRGPGLWPLFLSLLFLEQSVSHLPTGLWHAPAGSSYGLHAPSPAQWVTDTEHLPFDCRREPASLHRRSCDLAAGDSLRAVSPWEWITTMNELLHAKHSWHTSPRPLHCHSHSAGTKSEPLAVLPWQSPLFNKSIPCSAYP